VINKKINGVLAFYYALLAIAAKHDVKADKFTNTKNAASYSMGNQPIPAATPPHRIDKSNPFYA
jgi:hypothetical protein